MSLQRRKKRVRSKAFPQDRERANPGLTVDRRNFLKGALAFGGVVAAASGVVATSSGLTGCAKEEVAEPTYVEDGSQTSVIDTFEYVEDPPGLTESGHWTLPLGTVLHPSEGSWISATTTGATNTPPVSASAFSLVSGTLSTVVSRPVTPGTHQMIFSTRCSDEAYAWCELNTTTGNWALYAAPFSEGQITGTPSTLWEADAEWDTPHFVVSGQKVIWQVMPTATGRHSTEDSVCYVWKLGQKEATAQVSSPGRFATEPTVSEGIVTLTPRVRENEGVFYGIYAYDVSDDLKTVVDSMVLPQSIRPHTAVRMGENFVFQVEANYDSGGLLGQMGTYLGTSGGPFVAVSREPSAAACGRGPYILVKSRTSYVDADLKNERYGVLPALDNSVDYGEYPARIGTCSSFVTYTTVKDPTSGFPKEVQVRAFDLSA